MNAAPAALEEELRSCGVVETHYHVGPELLPRRYTVADLAEAARDWRASIVLKNHTYPTTPLASLARDRFRVRFLGSVVLNRFVGGLNPDAVVGALSGNRSVVGDGAPAADPPIVVWMPTVHAAAHLRVLGRAFDPRWQGGNESGDAGDTGGDEPVVAFEKSLRPTRELLLVLETIAKTGSTLATGHLAAEEIERLVPLALDMGVKRVILTHPHYPSVNLSNQQMKKLSARPEVFIEHCFAIHTIEKVPLETFAESILFTGPDQVVLSTDFGQVCSDPFPVGTLRYAQALGNLLDGKIGHAQFMGMFSSHGLRALGLEAE
jgi:hypothetical protein